MSTNIQTSQTSQTSTVSILGLIITVLLIILMLIVLDHPKIRKRSQVPVEDYLPYAQSGDIILLSGRGANFFHRYWQSLLRFFSGDREWTHVAPVIKLNNEFYVLEISAPFLQRLSFDISYSPDNSSGFIRLDRYLQYMMKHAHLGVRRINKQTCKVQPFPTDQDIAEWAVTLNRHLVYKYDMWDLIKARFRKRKLLDVPNFYFTCVEGVGWLLEKMGYRTSADVCEGMGLYPFSKSDQECFGPIIYFQPKSSHRFGQNLLKLMN
jgi:hypothetical protein